ncbi:MAG: tetratricopeptide repeat protein [Magnetospirillum sp.]|nr:tetratricopeptide repeat protein [Magnetospirillum sp.]
MSDCLRGIGPVLTLVLMLLLPIPLAWAQTSPRAADHDGYGRLVFDWDGPVKFSAETVNGQLIIRFDRPMAGDPKVVLKPLARYLKGATLSPDRMMVTFPLAIPVQVKSFQTGSSVVVDLTESKTPTSSVAPPPAPAQTNAAEAPKPVAEKPAEPLGPAIDLMVRGGEHTGFNRLVFDWPKPVGYSVDEAGGRVSINFDRLANVNTTSLKASLPSDVGFLEARNGAKGTSVVLSLPPGMRVRHFTSGPRIAVDLVRPAGAPPPPRANGAAAPPLAPALGTEEQPPALKPLDQQSPAAPAPGPVNGKTNGKTNLSPGPASPAAAPPAQVEMAGKGADEIKAAPVGKVVSLGFPFDKPTGAAVFRRAGWLWVVFDLKAEMDPKLLKRTGGDVVLHVEQVQGFKGTAVRMITRQGFNPSVRKEGQLWVLDIHEQPMAPKVGFDVSTQIDFQDRGRVVITAAEGSADMILRDPEVGDTIHVVTVPAIGAGVRTGRDYPGAELLPSAQGVAVIPRADNVRLDTNKSTVEITMPGGLFLSPVVAPSDTPGGGPAMADAQMGAESMATAPLDISKWLRGGNDKFVDDHRKLISRLAYVRPDEKNAQRMEIARHYLANGFAAEALGELRVMAAVDPAIIDTPAFRAVRGASSFLMNRDEDAIADLSMPALKEDPRVQLFLAAASARSLPDPNKQALVLRLAPEDIKGWPRTLRMSIGEIAAKTVARAGDAKGAAKIVDSMMGPGLSKRDVGKLSYLSGMAAQAGKQYDQAISRYRDAEASESRPDRAYAARDRVELMLKLKQMTPVEAIRDLEKLRFAWRGEDFEYQLMKRLGQLQIAAGRYGEGLRSMHSLVANYPDNPDIGKVQEEMSDTFNRLFLTGEADKLNPVVAIGLYDEFQELTPSGTQGDEMIRRLADRLAGVDLLERSGELLRHQVEFRLAGPDKARVGTRLAFLNLSDRKPNLALEALEASEVPEISADLAAQRRYIRVQALSDLGRSAEALALIINDQSEEANRLRGDINWKLKRWPEAAAALESTIVKPIGNRPLDPAMARRLLDTATAMTLAKDERGLTRLRRTYAPLMAQTQLREAFDLLTSEPERGIIDYRRLGDKIKQAQDFQTFMGEWQKRVKAQGLSSTIN